MPGIVGIISRTAGPDLATRVREMLECQMHEPFYRSATYFEPRLGLWAGWNWHEESSAGVFPAWSESGKTCLILCGEMIGAGDSSFESGSGNGAWSRGAFTRLLNRHEKQGAGFFEELNGWFSGLLVDFQTPRVTLFNDRYGMKRIYHTESEWGFCFSSEAKSLLRIIPGARSFDAAGLGEHLACGCALENKTLFSGVSLLPPGSSWTFAGGSALRKDVYFRKEDWERQNPVADDRYYSELRAVFPRALGRQLQDSAAKAISLTGGVDSRLVMAWSGVEPGKLPCYTFGGPIRESSDVRLGREVARLSGQSHTTISVGGEFLSQFSELSSRTVWISDGTMDVSGAVELYVNREARSIAPVRLNGNYGSEILRRLVAFGPSPIPPWLFSPELIEAARQARGTYARLAEGHPLSFIAFRQVPWFHHARYSIEQSQLTPRSPFLDNELVALAYRAGASKEATLSLLLRLVAEGSPELGSLETDRGALGPSASVGTLLGRCWQEATFKAEYAFDYGMPSWLCRLDRAMRPLRLERLFLGRHKFYHFRTWYRDELSEFVREVLLDPSTRRRPYFQGGNLERMVQDHIRGSRNYTTEIHQALGLELTVRQLIDRADWRALVFQGGAEPASGCA